MHVVVGSVGVAVSLCVLSRVEGRRREGAGAPERGVRLTGRETYCKDNNIFFTGWVFPRGLLVCTL